MYSEEFDEQQASKIKAKTDMIDKQVRKQERMIGRIKGDGYKEIEAGDQVNDMILLSIKAKLALLDKFNSK